MCMVRRREEAGGMVCVCVAKRGEELENEGVGVILCTWCVLSLQEGAQGDANVHSEEHILPGSVSELNDFEQQTATTACYAVHCNLPEVRVHLPSKQFLETLYNR